MTSAGGRTVSIFEATRLGLAKLSLSASSELVHGFERATATSAETLLVARVGVWLWSADGQELRCATMFDLRTRTHVAGAVLKTKTFPRYAKALSERRVIAADDARTAPETRELSEIYLNPLGITSILDAPLYRAGEVVGVVCHEHIGAPRQWLERERDFAASIADLIAVLLEQATRMELESALAAQREQAAKTAKFEALARLGAGLAHDFNNVLAAIMLRAEALRRRNSNDMALAADVDALITEGKFGAKLVRELLSFAKQGPSQPTYVDLTATVNHLGPSLDAMGRECCQVVVETQHRALVVRADPTQVEQVLVNLICNARDAGARRIHVRVFQETDEAVISVSDDGEGMDPKTLSHVFEPFFTTKGDAGTGLGLPTVQSIVQQNGGRIDAASTLGRGSEFVVRLPRAL